VRIANEGIELIRRTPIDLGDSLGELDFPESPEYNDRWWSGIERPSSLKRIWFSATIDEAEVARIFVEERVSIDEDYGVPRTRRAQLLEIPFFEVAVSYRGMGIGKRVIDLITDSEPTATFAAFSEDADGFWASLGWNRFIRSDHEERPSMYRPLYMLFR